MARCQREGTRDVTYTAAVLLEWVELPINDFHEHEITCVYRPKLTATQQK